MPTKPQTELNAIEQRLSPTPRVEELFAQYHDRTVKRLRIWNLARQLERELITAERELRSKEWMGI